MSRWNSSNSRSIGSGDISTLLSKDTEIRGSIRTQGPIRVDGTVHGDLTSAKTVTVGPSGTVDGNISGEDIIIAGKVKGTLTARGKIALESTAQIEGDLHTTRLSIAEGAVFRGQSNMGNVSRPALRTVEPKPESAVAAQRDQVVAA